MAPENFFFDGHATAKKPRCFVHYLRNVLLCDNVFQRYTYPCPSLKGRDKSSRSRLPLPLGRGQGWVSLRPLHTVFQSSQLQQQANQFTSSDKRIASSTKHASWQNRTAPHCGASVIAGALPFAIGFDKTLCGHKGSLCYLRFRCMTSSFRKPILGQYGNEKRHKRNSQK